MSGRNEAASVARLENLIHEIRGQRVMLDSDLARIYGVPTYRLNEAVKRNKERFPSDFMFRLTPRESAALRSQIAILELGRGRHRKYLPYVFTEHGSIMAANVLNSPRAVQMSVFVVRAFVRMRSALTNSRDLARKLVALEKELKKRLDIHDVAIVDILRRMMDMLNPPALPEPKRRKIGFLAR